MLTMVTVTITLLLSFPGFKVGVTFLGHFFHEDANVTIWSQISYNSSSQEGFCPKCGLAPHTSRDLNKNYSPIPHFKPLESLKITHPHTLQIATYLAYSSEARSH